MANDLKIASPQQIGPLQVWPLMWERLASHQYKVASGLDNLVFEEYENEDTSPVIDWIQVHNSTSSPILIPSGWIVSKGLMQERILVSAEYIEPESTTSVLVSCVEKGRWETSEVHRESSRAPLSVIGAGFDFDSQKGLWVLDSNTRQDRVWQQVERQEKRCGERPTNSLSQIMEEDSKSCRLQVKVKSEIKEKLRIHPDQNGVLIALNGEPLFSEFFSNPEAILKTVEKTLLGASFDATEELKVSITRERVESFLDEVRATKIHTLQDERWGVHLGGGTQFLDTHLTKSADERVMRLSTINRKHKALIAV